MKKYLVMMIAALTLFALLLTSCNSVKVGYAGSNVGNAISGAYKYFDGTETKAINAEAGKTIVIHYESEVKKGDLSLKVLDSDQKTIAELETNTSGTKEIKVTQDVEYTLVIKGSNTEGSFGVDWEVN